MVDMSPQDFEKLGQVLNPSGQDADDAYPTNADYGAGGDAQPTYGDG